MSSWLTSLPLEDEGYVLIKQCFQDLLCIRYGWKLNRLPIKCECGAHFDIEHALRCKKGRFVSLRHNELRNFTAKVLREVCHDVSVEPIMQPITGESLPNNANSSEEARLDVAAQGFWTTSQLAFFDVRVFTHWSNATSTWKQRDAMNATIMRRSNITQECYK